jgi:hypothetical protein
LCYVGFALSSALLLFVTLSEELLHRAGSVKPIFAILGLVGAVRSFSMPASRASLPQLVPEEQFQNAVAWNSSIRAQQFWGRHWAASCMTHFVGHSRCMPPR